MLEHEEFYCYHLPSCMHVRHPKWRDLHWRTVYRKTCNSINGMKEKYKDDKYNMRYHANYIIQNFLLFWCWNMKSSIVTTYQVCCTWDIPSGEISIEGGGTCKHVILLLGWNRSTKMINTTWGTIPTIEYKTCYWFDVGTWGVLLLPLTKLVARETSQVERSPLKEVAPLNMWAYYWDEREVQRW